MVLYVGESKIENNIFGRGGARFKDKIDGNGRTQDVPKMATRMK